MVVMKALSIRQPSLHAILYLGKDIENRPRRTTHQGWLALHASAKPRLEAVFPRGIRVPDLDALDYSAICGVARVVNVVTESHSKWFWHPTDGSTNYGWVLAHVTPLKTPIPCKGALGLWKVSAKVFREIQRQLPKLKFDA
jgi:hypothetical protein